MLLTLVVTAAALVAGTAAQSTDEPKAGRAAGQQTSNDRNTANRDRATEAQDAQTRQFIERAAQIHMTEAHLGKLANDSARSDQVKDLADRLRKDSENAYQRLARITDQFALTLPKSIDSEHQSSIRRFEALSPDALDQQYSQHVREQHQRRAKWFREQADQLRNSDLKQYATDQAAAFEQQSKRAQELDAQGHRTGANSRDRTQSTGTSSAGSQSSTQGTSRSESDARTSPSGEERQGTVIAFERGKSLKLQLRDRIGQHEYNLSAANLRADVPNDLKPGTQVVVTERIDPNGFRTLEVKRDSSGADRSNAGRKQE